MCSPKRMFNLLGASLAICAFVFAAFAFAPISRAQTNVFGAPSPVSCEELMRDPLVQLVYQPVGSNAEFQAWLGETFGAPDSLMSVDYRWDPSDAPNSYSAQWWDLESEKPMAYMMEIVDDTLIDLMIMPGGPSTAASTGIWGDEVMECLGEPDYYQASFTNVAMHSHEAVVLYWVDEGVKVVMNSGGRKELGQLPYEDYSKYETYYPLHASDHMVYWFEFGPSIDPRLLIAKPVSTSPRYEYELDSYQKRIANFRPWPGSWEEMILDDNSPPPANSESKGD